MAIGVTKWIESHGALIRHCYNMIDILAGRVSSGIIDSIVIALYVDSNLTWITINTENKEYFYRHFGFFSKYTLPVW